MLAEKAARETDSVTRMKVNRRGEKRGNRRKH